MLPWAIVVAVDLVSPDSGSHAVVRADMRHLPFGNHTVDGVLFAASLHYSQPRDVIPEVARVLRPLGLMVAVDSPIYPNATEQAAAIARSQAYYRRRGFPALASSYHPINAHELLHELGGSGLRVERWRAMPSIPDRLKRRFGFPFTSMVVARLP